jgi:integrase
MHRETGGHGPVLTLPRKKAADELREHLKRANVTRADLFAADENRKPMTFHDLRSTGATWMAIRGDEPLTIMHRAGHNDFKTTQGYIREAETLGRNVGEPFLPLPRSLVEWSSGRRPWWPTIGNI